MKVHTAVEHISEDDLRRLRESGLEVKTSPHGGLDLVPHRNSLQPKTMTGFLDTVTGEFVAVVLDPASKDRERKQRLMFWRRD